LERTTTQFETIESIQEALASHGATPQSDSTPVRSVTAHEQVFSEPAAKRFKPTNRPPTAVVSVLFDGLDTGEQFVVRGPKLTVGRSKGEIQITHDTLMSSKHFELVRPEKKDGRWRVHDLESTNGTFARISDAMLSDETEFLVGGHRFKFRDVDHASGKTDPEPERNVTQAWVLPADLDEVAEKRPSVVEVLPTGEGDENIVETDEFLIGSGPSSCGLVIVEDSFVDQVHARIYRDDHGRWHLENLRSLNGTWVRFKNIPIETFSQIQAGEQRFAIWTS